MAWRSVKDSLPQPEVDVLTWVAKYDGFCVINARAGGLWDSYDATVTHWQPLPEKPRGGA